MIEKCTACGLAFEDLIAHERHACTGVSKPRDFFAIIEDMRELFDLRSDSRIAQAERIQFELARYVSNLTDKIRQNIATEIRQVQGSEAVSAYLSGPDCRRCAEGVKPNGIPLTMQRMFLCPTCGNKRCPKATDHELACTGSNASGQPGSHYQGAITSERRRGDSA